MQVTNREVHVTIYLSTENTVVQFLQDSKRFFGFEFVCQQTAVPDGAIGVVDEVRISH